MVQVTGEIDPEIADLVLDVLRDFDLADDDVSLWRAASVQPLGWGGRRGITGRDQVAWAEILGRADENARPALIYLLYMFSAGVVAGVGVLTGSSILVVGAMALSPDLLPISATSVGLVERRWKLARRAAVTLALGLGVAVLASAATTVLLRITGRISSSLDLIDSVLGPALTHVGPGSVLVALVAGMAGMLAYETAGSAAVGVAISVTTIPAAAYLGDALGLLSNEHAIGAFVVLATNVVCILAGSSATLWMQRRRRSKLSAS
jgi:uncharacterized hydrophobic protein (TIGR00271 family)